MGDWGTVMQRGYDYTVKRMREGDGERRITRSHCKKKSFHLGVESGDRYHTGRKFLNETGDGIITVLVGKNGLPAKCLTGKVVFLN